MLIFRKRIISLTVLLVVILWLLLQQADPVAVVSNYIGFIFVGILGAIFANATGAGGGVIFVPLFSQFELTPINIVATSFAIQCFGMLAGAISWRDQYLNCKNASTQAQHWQAIPRLLLLCVIPSALGINLVQQMGWLAWIIEYKQLLNWTFGVFSIVLALSLFITLPKMKATASQFALSRIDYFCLPLIAFIGGMVTAWLSVGVGEMVAVYLILRNLHVTTAIACAVIITAFSVWSGVGYFVWTNASDIAGQYTTIVYPIAIFSGLGAIVGGTIARNIVMRFNPTKIKVFFASWVLLMGVLSLPL